MSGSIDPRLSIGSSSGTPHGIPGPPLPAEQYGEFHAQKSDPPAFGGARVEDLKAESAYAHTAPQPYFHYPPTPSQQQTPQQPGASTGSHSNQASPTGYAAPVDGETSPGQVRGAGGEGAGGGSGGGGVGGVRVGGVGGDQGDDAKRPRACEACRGLKVRCDQDPEHPEIPCKRCAKAGRQCIITQPSRKRQKKADSRVAELEKKLDALTAALHQSHHQQQQQLPRTAPPANMMQGRGSMASSGFDSHGYNQSPITRPGSFDPAMPPQKRRRTEDETPSYYVADVVATSHLPRMTSQPSNKEDDLVSKGIQEIQQPWMATSNDLKRYLHRTTPDEFVKRINSLISPELASSIFHRYTTKLTAHIPAVVFPESMTAEQLFKEKPILYVCVLSAASASTLHPDTSGQLAIEAVGAIADCVVRHGAKSLELIQAMQVLALHYKPPEQGEQTNFYQIIHMAAVMALDIGLGKRFNPAKARRGFGGPNANFAPGPYKELPQDSDTLEARRAWLTCYYLCASASMVLRRPNLVRWTNYMKECIEVLESHPDAYPSDKLFCQHVKIQRICEDIGLQFLMDDSTATISITDPKVTYALNVLENQLKNWKENIPPECAGKDLQFFEHVTALYLHEIALHFNHNIEDFRLPFTEESLKSVNNTSDTLTSNQIAAIEACLKAAHGILDTMLSYDVDSIRCLPMLLYFVRCVYAVVILIKMHVAVCTPSSELGKMMKPADLKVDYYLDKLISMFAFVSETDAARPHPKVLKILGLLRDWFRRHKESALGGLGSGVGGVFKGERDREASSNRQTPLHVLSQLATGNHSLGQQQPPADGIHGNNAAAAQTSISEPSDWTFDNPTVTNYSKLPSTTQPDAKFPRWNSAPTSTGCGTEPQPPLDPSLEAFSTLPPDPLSGVGAAGMPMVDPTNQEYGWGSGFEQAMDIALGGMDGLQGGGLDGWFLGDSMAPFGFNGELA